MRNIYYIKIILIINSILFKLSQVIIYAICIKTIYLRLLNAKKYDTKIKINNKRFVKKLEINKSCFNIKHFYMFVK